MRYVLLTATAAAAAVLFFRSWVIFYINQKKKQLMRWIGEPVSIQILAGLFVYVILPSVDKS